MCSRRDWMFSTLFVSLFFPYHAAFAAGPFSYNANNGVSYANRFATSTPSSRFFYTAPKDCTNFVSQCVWAAYGGYVPNNDVTTKNNMSSKFRMVPKVWQGGTGGGVGNWETVNLFWAYAIARKTEGPVATGYNNNLKYTSIANPRVTVRVGDVLQLRNGGSGNYTHSVYVTSILSGPVQTGRDWDMIRVAAHSNDRMNRPASDLISAHGDSNCYLRGLSFSAASFQK